LCAHFPFKAPNAKGVDQFNPRLAYLGVLTVTPQKGFGFIEPEDKSTDVFVHITAVQNSGMDGLAEDQMVSYELETGQNGKTSAVNLKAL